MLKYMPVGGDRTESPKPVVGVGVGGGGGALDRDRGQPDLTPPCFSGGDPRLPGLRTAGV